MGNNTCSVDGCERPVLNSQWLFNRGTICDGLDMVIQLLAAEEVADTVEQRFGLKSTVQI